jgi:Domain of unknown function (DUF5658)
MSALAKSLLLFVLNWLDAQLTLLWVHTNVATEGNGLMGQLLNVGDAPFLLVKLAVGAFAAFILYRCSHLPIARRGMQLVLMIYGLLMITHVAVGMSALGWHPPETIIGYLASVPSTVLAWLS